MVGAPPPHHHPFLSLRGDYLRLAPKTGCLASGDPSPGGRYEERSRAWHSWQRESSGTWREGRGRSERTRAWRDLALLGPRLHLATRGAGAPAYLGTWTPGDRRHRASRTRAESAPPELWEDTNPEGLCLLAWRSDGLAVSEGAGLSQ
jgi:hypothetical protein